MPHNPCKKRNSSGRKSQRQTTPEQSSTISEDDAGHTAHNEQDNDTRIPFYDDPNHVAYGWQQMATLPDFPSLHTLMHGAQVDPTLDPRSRPQTWPVEQQREPAKIEQSGFNTHPRRGQGPRRPPPLTDTEDRSKYYRTGTGRPKFKPFVDPRSTGPKDGGVAGDVSWGRPAQLTLGSKDVNQKMRIGQNQESVSPFLNLTEDLRKMAQRPRSKKLIIDELEAPQHADREAKRMPSLLEEPAPLRVRKKRMDGDSTETHSRSITLEQARMLRAEQDKRNNVQLAGVTSHPKSVSGTSGKDWAAYSNLSHGHEGVKVTVREVNNTEEDIMETLTTAITSWQVSAPAEKLPHEFGNHCAIPKQLDLAAIRAAKEKRMLPKLEMDTNINPSTEDQNSLHRAKMGSAESFATSMSSDFEKLSIPDGNGHNRSRRKWYKGFRRSG